MTAATGQSTGLKPDRLVPSQPVQVIFGISLFMVFLPLQDKLHSGLAWVQAI